MRLFFGQRGQMVVRVVVGLTMLSFGACAERPSPEQAEKACHQLAQLGHQAAIRQKVTADWKKAKRPVDNEAFNTALEKAVQADAANWKKTLEANKKELATCAEGFTLHGTIGQVECVLKSETPDAARDCRKQ